MGDGEKAAMKALLPILIFLLASAFSSPVDERAVCGDFVEGACDLSEYNIIEHNRYTNTPKECQEQCRQNSQCSWFTHFATQCYLLVECGRSEHCEGCVSGPEDAPDFETCPWPPVPTSGPTEPPKSTTTRRPTPPTTTTTTTTTRRTTTTTTKPTTTTKRTTTTTKAPTPPPNDCNDIHHNDHCDWDHGLLAEYHKVMMAQECQHICRGVSGATYFSHYNKGGDDYHRLADDDYTGVCGCFSRCENPTSKHCHHSCGDDFILRDGGWCHCIRGPLQPDVSTC